MTESFLLGVHAAGTIKSEMHEEDGELIFTDTMPASEVQKIIDQNNLDKQHEVRKTGPSGHGVVAARIPLPMWTQWQKEWREKYKPYMKWHVFLKRRLNSNEYQELTFQKI